MNKEYLKMLVDKASEIDAQNEILMEENRQKRLKEMSENIADTVTYLDGCSEKELLFATEVLEDLAEIFKDERLIVCVERNAERCKDKEIGRQLKEEINYMRLHG